jgi:FkbM family methyltransferase
LALIRALIKRILDVAGYLVVTKRAFGHNHLVDIQKIAKSQNIDVTVILDVGAHHGGSAESFRSAFPDANIHCFEPDPRSFHILKTRFAQNNRIHAHPLALTDVEGTLPFFIYENTCINSLEPSAPCAETYGNVAEEIRVEVSTVDAFLAANKLTRVNYMKVDTEGREPAVLTGAMQALKDQRIDFLFLEFNSVITSEKSSPLVDIARILEPLGYRFIATYNDYCTFDDQEFSVSNVLFSRTFSQAKLASQPC